ncbi:MAG: hypothetical protein JSR80_02580 [Verrucomicrobia bacterium]|nr:hypothetical protein [Verrucomicrobiota bacterium]
MRSWKYFSIFLNLACLSCIAQGAPSCLTILNYVKKNLPHHGILKNSDGFLYVDIDDEYIHQLVLFIQKEGFEEPPYFGRPDLVGAHITVIYPDEVKEYGISEIQECGEVIDFTPRECQVVRPLNLQEVDEVYFLSVDAPALDRIREKYGLPKREYDFHITIGMKPITPIAKAR